MISSKQILLVYTFPITGFMISWETAGAIQNWTSGRGLFQGFHLFHSGKAFHISELGWCNWWFLEFKAGSGCGVKAGPLGLHPFPYQQCSLLSTSCPHQKYPQLLGHCTSSSLGWRLERMECSSDWEEEVALVQVTFPEGYFLVLALC